MSTTSGRAATAPSGQQSVTAIATGVRSVSDVTSELLDRIVEMDGSIGAFRIVDDEAVRRRAKELDGRAGGTLRGLGVGVKDVIDTADLPTSYGSPLFAHHQPAADAEIVSRLKAGGALVIGKTESTEFAMFQPTRTRNPVDLGRTPGGSSSGSAAAVAAGMVPVALGTQTAGSVLRPAAYCGVYGFKPTRGWASTTGVWRLAESLDTIGLFSRSAWDLVLLHRTLALDASAAAIAPVRRPDRRVGVLDASSWGASDPEVADALAWFASRLSDDGWQVCPVVMPEAWRALPAHHETVMAVEVAKNLHTALGPRIGLISESAARIVERGDRCSAAEYLASVEAAREALTVMEPLAESIDVLLAPTALGVAPQGLEATGDPVMCRPWTLLGLPAANVPGYCRSDGLPVGVQALSVRRDDLGFLNDLVSIETAISEKE
jgi:Asp-tRNA(Asn)/Glu-tRNA(Gln) amidotransferase A subunit family amidase